MRGREAWIVFGVALAVRLVFLAELAGSPSFDVPIIDGATYDALARRLADGNGIHAGFFWQGVFYPSFLAGIYSVFGPSLIAARIAQLVLGALTCVLTYRLGRRLISRRVGFAAGLVTAAWGPLVFYEADLVATGWITFWAVALLLLFARAGERPTVWRALLLGLACVLAVLTWAVFLPFVVAGIAVTCWRTRSVGFAAAAAAGFFAIAVPTALVNRAYNGVPTILPSSGGLNLFIGNNPNMDETWAVRPWSEEWRAIRAMPGPTAPEDGYARSRFYTGQVIDWARREPVGFVAGLMKKALYFVSSPELPRNEDIYVFRQWSHLLSIGVWRVGPFGFPFALLFPLAAIGALVHRRRIGAHAWMLLVMFPAGVVLVFVSSRYRVPLVPLLAVLGAAGAAACIERWRRRDRDGLARAGVIAAIALAVTCWPVHPSVWRTNYEAELYRMVGVEAYREARDLDAIAPLERALAIDPDHADTHYDLAVVLRRLGRFDEARRHLRAAVRARPDSTRARRALAALQ